MATRNSPEMDHPLGAPGAVGPVATGAVIYQGEGVVRNAQGYLQSAAVATGLISVGVAHKKIDNTGGAAGAKNFADYRQGAYRFDNSSSSDEVTQTEIGKDVYWAGPGQVAKTNGSNARSRAGVCIQVDSVGVWVVVAAGQ